MDLSKNGKLLRDLRKSKGLTQTQLAQYLHMTQQQYSRFETGKFELNYQQIYDICKLLDTTPNELFEIDF